MIHLERVTLPPGLSALAHRDKHGNLVIYVSAELTASRQRAAVVEAIRASRRTSWRAGLPTAGIALVVAARSVFRRAATVLRFRPVAWGAAATATVAGAATAAVLITTPPRHHAPAAAGLPTIAPSAVAPAPQPGGQPPARPAQRSRPRLVTSNGSSAAKQPSAAGQPSASPAPGSGSSSSSAPQPAPSSSPTEPAPSPSPSPTSTGVCVTLLGIKTCLPTVSVSVKA